SSRPSPRRYLPARAKLGVATARRIGDNANLLGPAPEVRQFEPRREHLLSGFLTEQNLMWRARAREVAEKVVRPLAAKYDKAQEYPWEVKEALAEAGLMGVWIPKEYGGQGVGIIDLCICVEELSRACGGVGVLYAVNALGTFPVMVGGTEEQKHRWLTPIAKGEKLISFGLSEKFAGSDAASLRCNARREGDYFILNGEKKWNTNGG